MIVGARWKLLLLFASCSVLPGGEPVAPPPAQNWVLPLFTDKEGFRSLTARGSNAQQAADKNYVVSDLNITVFSGDAAARVESIFLSPLATFDAKSNLASGTKSVRVIRDDFEATGTRWSYDHAEKRVTLDGDVRIVFNTELTGILK